MRLATTSDVLSRYWSVPAEAVAARLSSSVSGLTTEDAEARRRERDASEPRPDPPWLRRWRVLTRQLKSPLLGLLVFAAIVSALSGEWSDAAIVLVIVGATVAVGFVRESSAERAADALRSRIRTTARVRRDGRVVTVAREAVVPGDVIVLAAGSIVPADAILLDASDCFVSEAMLTGESFPVEKQPGLAADTAGLPARTNCVFLGTNVRSGTATALAVATGSASELGRIAGRLRQPAPLTEFDRGIRRFGYLLTSAMLVMVVAVFTTHVVRGRPPVEMLLFAVALAVGLSPELLPAILSINLARGAQMMARRGVLVRHLNAIENLGSMDVLCTDKTGTLTEGRVRLESSYGSDGTPSERVWTEAAINASLETGLANPLDDAILEGRSLSLAGVDKQGEIPFDFVRKRVSVVVKREGGIELITKGAFGTVVEACDRLAAGAPLDAAAKASLVALHERWSAEGTRVLAVAAKAIEEKPGYSREDEHGLTFLGFLTFLDRPKADVRRALDDLAALGVSVKVITGDNALVARHVADVVGLRGTRTLTGPELRQLDTPALARLVGETDIFAEIDPMQKERIILTLRRTGHVVGFLGDGVNDAPAMHAADTSLSVDQAVDVAKEAADFVLLERDLDIIRDGIEEGRRTFANTLKYILTTTSANLGNMVSMAGASLFLPFLPLTAGQILLNNLLSDIPAVGIADDAVDREMVERPPRWDTRFIGRFMAEFGLLSSVFDFATFGLLLWVFHASEAAFRTGWFVESLLTELVVALVVRTRRPFFRSRPGRLLLWTSLVMIVVAVLLPYLPAVAWIGFVPLPPGLLASLVGVTVLYVFATEAAKTWFYRLAVRTTADGSTGARS